MELPKTEAELSALIEAAVSKKVEEMTSEHNKAFAAERTKHESELKKAREQANLSNEEKLKAQLEEQREKDKAELDELRLFKKNAVISQRLAKENLPDYFKNDYRLINSTDEDFEKNLKSVKSDYESSKPKGTTHSSVVQTNVAGSNSQSSTDAANQEMAQAIEKIIG